MTAQTYGLKARYGYKAGSRTAKIHRLDTCEARRVAEDGSLRFTGTWECGRRCDDIALVADWTKFERATCDGCAVGNPTEFVYFAERNGLIKIGWTRNLGRRMRQLDASLLAAIPGGRFTEGSLHRLFADDAVVGEWHRWSDAMCEFLVTAHGNGQVVAGSMREAA